jgi:hypothetical protein
MTTRDNVGLNIQFSDLMTFGVTPHARQRGLGTFVLSVRMHILIVIVSYPNML